MDVVVVVVVVNILHPPHTRVREDAHAVRSAVFMMMSMYD